MSLSDDENRRWKELEAELGQERRLVVLARRLRIMPSPWVMLGWAAGAALGFALYIAGAVTHTGGAVIAGVAILAVTLVLAGIALIATGVNDVRRQRRLYGRDGKGRP
jgi:predicted phage tail protein